MIYVIVVTHNGRKWYDKCFESLKKASIPIHIIVIDNASTDNTVSYIKENYPGIYLIENEENLGFGKANNIGIEYALKNGADFVFLLNQDTWVGEKTIELLFNSLQENHEYGIVSPIHLRGDGQELDYRFYSYLYNSRTFLSDIILARRSKPIYEVKFVNAAFWLLTRKCIEKIGYFDTLFSHYGEDEDYCNRLNYHNIKIGIVPSTFGWHDRPQGALALEKMSLLKLNNLRKVNHILILKNINKPLFICLYLVLRNFMYNVLIWIRMGKMKQIFIEIGAIADSLFQIGNIIKKRKKCSLELK